MKIFHEAPKDIFEDVQLNTDGDYALVHLFETDEEYFKLFQEAVDKGREVILDNSIFELGTAFDAERFVHWVLKLQPTWYVIPDALDNMHDTLSQFFSFVKNYPHIPGKRIGVLQGTSETELLACYDQMAPHCDKIAISFNYEFWSPDGVLEEFVKGRQAFIDTLITHMNDTGMFMPLHLLGCALPQEFKYYNNMLMRGYIDSVDTSNPVVHGLYQVYYEAEGLERKISTKLHTLINEKVAPDQWLAVMYNILEFRGYCNG